MASEEITEKEFGQCRCCIKDGYHKDIMKYYRNNGIRETYYNMILECFNLFLSTTLGVPTLICSGCVEQLRQAISFRSLIVESEQKLLRALGNKETVFNVPEVLIQEELNIKVEVKEESAEQDDGYCHDEEELKLDDDYNKANSGTSDALVLAEHNYTAASKTTLKKNKKKISYAPEGASTDINCKSQGISSEAKHKKPVTKKKTLEAPETVISQPLLQKTSYQNTALLNKSIRLNTSLILKNSTVVPFRNKRNNNGKYTCFYCEVNFFQIREMRKHVNETHDDIGEDEIIKILKMPAAFKLTKAELSQVYCKICRQDLQNLNNLIKHLIDIHKKTFHHVDFKPAHGILGFILESENPTCYECHKEFPFFQALVTHMTGQHSQNFACDKCDKKFLFKTAMVQHLFQCHNEHAAAKIYKCKFCDENFRKISMKQNHMRKAHGYGKFRCVECGATFLEHSQRVRHVVEVHNYKRPLFKCELCPKVCMSASKLSAHVKTHGEPHDCEICGKKVTSGSSLKRHLRVHSGERPYACQFCEKRFKSHGTLTTHERGHMNDKRYVCEICDAAFIQIHCLRRHYTSRHPDCGIDLKSIRAKKNN